MGYYLSGLDITFDDDSDATGGHAAGQPHNAAEMAAFSAANFTDLGTFPKSYRIKGNTIRHKAGSTAVTTWKDNNVVLLWDNGKTYLTTAAGQANGYTEWGLLATGANGRVAGYKGVVAKFGANPGGTGGINGNVKLYGCTLENLNAAAGSSRIFIQPGFLTGYSEIIDTSVFTLAGTQAYGLATGPINRIRRLACRGLGAGINGRIVQFSSPDADGITFYFPNGSQKLNTGGYVRLGNPEFVGPSVGGPGDVQTPTAGIYLNPIWSQHMNPKMSGLNEEWLNYSLLVTDQSLNPVSGVTVDIWDPFDHRYVLNTVTGSDGQISFTALQSIAEAGAPGATPAAPFPNALLVNGHNNDGQQHDHVPFTLYINRNRGLKHYLPITRYLTFPYKTFLTNQRQWSPISQHIILERVDGAGNADAFEEWRAAL